MNRKPSMLRPGIRRLLGLDVARREVFARELEDELQLHLDLRAEQLRKQGLSAEAAMAEARVRYGAIHQATREIHQHARRKEQRMQWRIALGSLTQDVRYALRTLGRSKAWTSVAVLTLALGTGANTAVFSVVNDLLFDPLRYPEHDRLTFISRVNTKSGFEMTPTMSQLAAWKAARSFALMEGVGAEDQTMIAQGAEPSMMHVGMISPTFMKLAGANVLLGRPIRAGDTVSGAPPVVLLSEHVWRTRFGAAQDVIGRSLRLAETDRTIVGVMPDRVRVASFSTESTDLWTPFPRKAFLAGPIVGRLAPGVTIATAQQELQAIANGLAKQDGTVGGTQFDVTLRSPGSRGSTRSSIFLIAGAVSLLLLIACANVAHLLLARGSTRERELSIRAALGAGRGRIVRQLVTECMILALAGCVAGLVIGALALKAIIAVRPESMGELANVRIDRRVLLGAVAISALSGLMFGVIAGYGGRGTRNFDSLRGSVASTVDRKRHRLRSFLVVTENALSVVLLIGAMLLIRTVFNLYDIHPGYDPSGVYGMSVTLPESRYATPASREAYAERFLAEARRIPGVEVATLASYVPPRSGIAIGKWISDDAALPSKNDETNFTIMNSVMPDYFSVMRMRLLSGRAFDGTSPERREVIISRSLATRLWGNANAVGRRMRSVAAFDDADKSVTWNVVVGVAPDAAMLTLQNQDKTPAIYFPAQKSPEHDLGLIVRMRSGEMPHAALRRLSLSLDPLMPPPSVISVSDLLLQSVSTQRFMMALLTLFAALAVVLSAIGLYGVIAYMVSQSTREIGVRVALGAARRDVIKLVMQQGVVLSAAGLALGLVAALWGGRLLRSSLYGVSSTDPMSYLVGSAVLLTLAVAACVAPTVRALRIDPMVAMRSE